MEEQVLLQEGIAQFGMKKPTKIAAFMGGVRSAEQVREKIKQFRAKNGFRKPPPLAANDHDKDGKLEEDPQEDNGDDD